jgi:hypothetical protein
MEYDGSCLTATWHHGQRPWSTPPPLHPPRYEGSATRLLRRGGRELGRLGRETPVAAYGTASGAPCASLIFPPVPACGGWPQAGAGRIPVSSGEGRPGGSADSATSLATRASRTRPTWAIALAPHTSPLSGRSLDAFLQSHLWLNVIGQLSAAPGK